MMLRNSWFQILAAAVLIVGAAHGQPRTNYSGTWELTRIQRSDGMNSAAGKTFKETQVWTHQEPKLNLKIMTWDERVGYRTLELAYTTNGTSGLAGYLVRADGTKDPVNGSARWDGNHLVYEEDIPNAKKGAPRRIIRTCILEDNGQKMVLRQVYWMVGDDKKSEAQWFYEKKSGTP